MPGREMVDRESSEDFGESLKDMSFTRFENDIRSLWYYGWATPDVVARKRISGVRSLSMPGDKEAQVIETSSKGTLGDL